MGQFFDNFVKRPIKPLGKILSSPPKTKKSFFFSELQKVEVQICVRPNFPIINLILFTAFHKVVRSRGTNTNAIGHDCILHSIPTNSFLYSCIHIALGECAVVVGRGAAGINYLRLHHQGKG